MYRENLPVEVANLEDEFQRANEHRDFSVYTWLMDAAEIAKARQLFPHFRVREGAVIIDKGSGTGKLAERAAREFPRAKVYAQDISHELRRQAEDNRSLINLVYGDVRERVFPKNSADVIYSSTCGHEVNSFGGPGALEQMLAASLAELKPEGQYVHRDMAKSTLQGDVYMEILSSEGLPEVPQRAKDDEINYSALSTKALFERFHKEFQGGNVFNYEIVNVNGKELIKVDATYAQEFYLRKDYTGNWRNEIKEIYTYWTPEQTKQKLEQAGFVSVKVEPEVNEYILKNRLQGKIVLYQTDAAGALQKVDFPPTHFTVVGEKPAGESALTLEVQAAADYQKLLKSVEVDEVVKAVTIGHHRLEFEGKVLTGLKKQLFKLKDQPLMLKVARADTLNDHEVFKSLYQIVERQKVLEDYGTPYLKIVDFDRSGPPYRYVVQEAAPPGAFNAAELIYKSLLTETDIRQMVEIVNKYEKAKQWQLDTNPFAWFRVAQSDGSTKMVYASGKVYRYEDGWEFKRVGLLQWANPEYVRNAKNYCAAIPLARDAENYVVPEMWKKYLAV